MEFKHMKSPILCSICLVLLGCSAVGTAPVELEIRARNMSAPPGKALVYILCVKGHEMPVFCDDEYIGSVAGKRFVYSIMEPGNHIFTSHAENVSELPIVLESDKIYYFEVLQKTGVWAARNHLVRIDERNGREKLKKCRLSSKNTYRNRPVFQKGNR